MSIVILPTGGLCNMLRVTFSYYMKALSENKKLIVIWIPTDACPGYFTQFFNIPANMEIISAFDKYKISQILSIDYNGCFVHPNFNIPSMYNYLSPNTNIFIQVQNNITLLENRYIAVHIRRTDHVAMAKSQNQFTTDLEFMQFLDTYPDYNIYLATDNRQSQDLFHNKYKQRIKTIKFINPMQRQLRHTPIEDAIIDIYTCVNASFFKGSGYSSFTDLITNLRTIKNN
jgi:hypothetical protein